MQGTYSCHPNIRKIHDERLRNTDISLSEGEVFLLNIVKYYPNLKIYAGRKKGGYGKLKSTKSA